MSHKPKALLEFLRAMGCSVRELPAHAAVRFDVDSPHLDTLRKLVWGFCREEGMDWVSENRATGDIWFNA